MPSTAAPAGYTTQTYHLTTWEAEAGGSDQHELEVSEACFKPPGRAMREITLNKVALMLGSTTIKANMEIQAAVKTVCFSLKTEGLEDWSEGPA